MMSQTWISALVLLTAVLSLVSINTGMVSSQQYTTNTILQTVTTQVTVTSYSYSTVTSESLPVDFIFTPSMGPLYGGGWTWTEPDKPYIVNMALPRGNTEYLSCYAWPIYAQIESGQQIMIGLTSDRPISLYLMTAAAYDKWNQTGRCAAGETLQAMKNFKSYNLNWAAPASGTYYVVFLNYNDAMAMVQVDFTNMVVKTAQTQTIPYAMPPTVATETLTSLQVTTVPPLISMVTSPVGVFALLVAVGVVVLLVAVFRGKKRRKKEKPEPSQVAEAKPPEQTTVTSVPPKEPVTLPEKEAVLTVEAATVLPKQKLPTEQFCINCGSKLPTNSKFCNNCGTKQP